MRCSSSFAGALLAVVSIHLHVHAKCCAQQFLSCAPSGALGYAVVRQEGPLAALPVH